MPQRRGPKIVGQRLLHWGNCKTQNTCLRDHPYRMSISAGSNVAALSSSSGARHLGSIEDGRNHTCQRSHPDPINQTSIITNNALFNTWIVVMVRMIRKACPTHNNVERLIALEKNQFTHTGGSSDAQESSPSGGRHIEHNPCKCCNKWPDKQCQV